MRSWKISLNEWLTGPTTSAAMPFCGGLDWPYVPVAQEKTTVALVPAPRLGDDCCAADEVQMLVNARLIAAAPDLLTACKWVLAHECSAAPCPLCADRVKAAIALAEGRSSHAS